MRYEIHTIADIERISIVEADNETEAAARFEAGKIIKSYDIAESVAEIMSVDESLE